MIEWHLSHQRSITLDCVKAPAPLGRQDFFGKDKDLDSMRRNFEWGPHNQRGLLQDYGAPNTILYLYGQIPDEPN